MASENRLDAEPPGLADYRAELRTWLAANLEPRRESWNNRARANERFTPEYVASQRAVQRRLFEGGYAGITWPVRYGGRGLPQSYERAFVEESRGFALPELSVLGSATYQVCGPMILAHAVEEFKLRHIPRMLSGDELWAQFFSESGAGTDLAAVATRADRRGPDWVINGSKMWSSNADQADYGLCLARSDSGLPKHQGLTWYAIPANAPGLTIRPIRQIDGTYAFCAEFFDDVVVPDSARIGPVNGGWDLVRMMLTLERDTGIDKDKVERDPGPLAPDLVEVGRYSGTLGQSWVRQLIATAHVNDYVRMQLAARIGTLLPARVPAPAVAAYGKLAAGILTPIRAGIGQQLAAEQSVAWDPDSALHAEVASNFLNGRAISIAGGSNEMQRNAIAEQVLELPREPRHDR